MSDTRTTSARPFAVYFRKSARHQWQQAHVAPTAEAAWAAMYDLMTSGPSGDWTVAPADLPPSQPERGCVARGSL